MFKASSARSCDYLKFRNRNKNTVFCAYGLEPRYPINTIFFNKTKTIEYRYRQNFYSGNLTINGAFSDDELLEDNLRYFFHAVGSFDLKYGVNFSFDAGKVGDDLYLGDYVYSDESDLNSEINLGKHWLIAVNFSMVI